MLVVGSRDYNAVYLVAHLGKHFLIRRKEGDFLCRFYFCGNRGVYVANSHNIAGQFAEYIVVYLAYNAQAYKRNIWLVLSLCKRFSF